MNYVLKSQLEKLLLEIEKENISHEPYCVGGFIIQPIHYAELVTGEMLFDEEGIIDEFQYYVCNNLSEDFYNNQYE